MDNNKIDFGKVAFTLANDWDGNSYYSRLTAVRNPFDGCGYVAKKDNRGIRPDSDQFTWMKMVDKGDKGDEGPKPQMGVETDAQGNTYITVDGERITDSQGRPMNFKGPKGDKGDPMTFDDLTAAQKAELKGENGQAAGFGIPTASINNATGTPSITVTASGPDTAKVFNFAFKNMKGAKGDTGVTAASATVDSNVGTPSVDVSLAGSTLSFAFHNLKGEPGSSPSAVTEQTVAGWGFTKNAGTVTKIKINNSTKTPDGSGIVNLGTGYLTSHQDISGKEDKSNKVTSISSSSTDTQYPSAKCLYTIVGNIETLLAAL